jgi:hypothetical protein
MTTEYARKTVGHILHHLRERGIPERIAGTVTVGAGVINLFQENFGVYKYFNGIEQPLFRFQDRVYGQHHHVVDGDYLISNFHLSLSVHNTAGLVVTGWDATQDLRAFLHRMFTNMMTDECYAIHKDAGAFFQGGSVEAPEDEHGFIYVEFWKPEKAQAFVDYLNKNFKRPLIKR